MMVKRIIVMLLAGAFLVISGCGGPTHVPPSGVSPSFVHTSVTYPSIENSITNYNFTKDDIEILGPVSVSTSSIRILMLFSWGDNGYSELLEEAKKEYPETDALINIYADTKYSSFLLFVYQGVTTKLSATAVKFK